MQEFKFTLELASKDIIREKLLLAINKYEITLETLNKITQIDIDWLSDYINENKKISDLSIDKYELFCNIIAMLSDGMTIINEDERVKGIIDVLVQAFGLKYETISLYSGLEKHDIECFMQDSTTIDYEKKYKLATAVMMLHYLFKKTNIS